MDTSTLMDLYRDMRLIRAFEQGLEREFERGNVPGMLHTGLGQEATQAELDAVEREIRDLIEEWIAFAVQSPAPDPSDHCGVDSRKLRRRLSDDLELPLDGGAQHPAVNAVDLALESRSGEGVRLSTANTLFVQDGLQLRDEFVDTAADNYGAPVRTVDFRPVHDPWLEAQP